jgi:hypothetical protein
MVKFLIYGLYCPFTGNIHYVGKTSVGMIRPLSHITNSHSEKINLWVSQLKFLNYKPVVKIIEECSKDNLDERELYWINKEIESGAYLLNSSHNDAERILIQKEYKFEYEDIVKMGALIREERRNQKMTTVILSLLAKIDRSTLVRIENGNRQVTLKNIKKVLSVLGLKISIIKN